MHVSAGFTSLFSSNRGPRTNMTVRLRVHDAHTIFKRLAETCADKLFHYSAKLDERWHAV